MQQPKLITASSHTLNKGGRNQGIPPNLHQSTDTKKKGLEV